MPEGSTISFMNIEYHVKVKSKRGFCKTSNLRILNRVSGIFTQGMNAILGPTGCGKTSLLDLLAGRKDPQNLLGNVLVDGRLQPKNYNCIAGYVVQDDIVMGTLTVYENIMFSANMRLPSSVSQEEKTQRVEAIIDELGITRCASTRVGNEFTRGISGGERKRTSIGMELVTVPTVLFLDEPTTGLDAFTAHSVMSVLHQLSRNGRTVIFSIHQPRFTIFELFDRLMLLSIGNTVYHGPASEALKYFNNLGYECQDVNRYNPADFLLDVMRGQTKKTQPAINGAAENSFDQYPVYESIEGYQQQDAPGDEEERPLIGVTEFTQTERQLSNTLAINFRKSEHKKRLMTELQPIFNNFQCADRTRARAQHALSFGSQMYYLYKRNMLNILRTPQTSVIQVGVSIFYGVLLGLIFLQDARCQPGDHLRNVQGALLLVGYSQVFVNMSAVHLFIKQRIFFIHESASGFYHVVPYFLTKVFCDILSLRLIPITVFSILTYFLIGFQLDIAKFFIYWLTLLLLTLTAAAYAFLVSASVNDFIIANLVCGLVYGLMLQFNSVTVDLNSIPAVIRWIQYFSIFRYSIRALEVNEMYGSLYCTCGNNTLPCQNGTAYLHEQKVVFGSAWDFWQNQFSLLCLMIGVLALALIQMSRIKVWK